MKRIIPLTPRRWLALEIFRRMKHERVEEHPLRQLFWECTLRCNVPVSYTHLTLPTKA